MSRARYSALQRDASHTDNNGPLGSRYIHKDSSEPYSVFLPEIGESMDKLESDCTFPVFFYPF